MNRAKKSEYVRTYVRTELRTDVRTELQSLDVATKYVGYIEPGHGVKGRQIWLESEDKMIKRLGVNIVVVLYEG